MADSISSSRPSYLVQVALRIWVKIHIVYLAFKAYRSIKKVKLVFSEILKINRKISGGKRKYVVKNGKYWIGLYMPAFPSKDFDRYILTEMNMGLVNIMCNSAYTLE